MMMNIILDIQSQLGDAFKFTQPGQLGGLVSNLVGVFIMIAGLLLILYFVWAGLRWMTSGGEKQALAEARGRLNSALIGFLIVLASWALYTLIRYMLGLSQPAGGPASPASPAGECLAVCQETSCQGYNSFCYKDCRCICDSAGKMWYYDNPWCDADNTQYVCKNGIKTSDHKGVVSGRIIDTCPGNQ